MTDTTKMDRGLTSLAAECGLMAHVKECGLTAVCIKPKNTDAERRKRCDKRKKEAGECILKFWVPVAKRGEIRLAVREIIRFYKEGGAK